MIPASYGHLADNRRGHRAPSYFVRMVFPFELAGTKKRVIGFPQKSPRFAPGGGGLPSQEGIREGEF